MKTPAQKFICIHGHFYQPPRENPWLEAVESQETAHPFHDWNERIAEECYTPNTHARILDDTGRLREIINNYEYISFNFGPTLMSWLERSVPSTYAAILNADAVSLKRRSGHGNALAQAYNHIIMPLASSRDKVTQVLWGIEDFKKRFRRDPEGMWLPETAVDNETLEILADNGILFTVLAPRQARKFRFSTDQEWLNGETVGIDPSTPYLCQLSGGRSITLFFYDGPISQSIAFEQILNNGETFKNRLLDAFSPVRKWTQLIHIATDGESYGHHHRFGEMALAYCIEGLLSRPDVQLTNYGEFLEKFPPFAEAEIVERSSWSCIHGVKRWAEDCGCCSVQRPDWNQAWRVPLRKSMDFLADRVDTIFQAKGPAIFKDPWAARDAYISVILENHANSSKFLRTYAKPRLDHTQRILALELLEIQRNRMLMYTSCGWFFDDITGIESQQVLRYAARVIQCALQFDPELLDFFTKELAPATSNIKSQPKGDELFLERVWNQAADLAHVAGHVAISSAFENIPIEESIYCFSTKVIDMSRESSGRRSMLTGHLAVTSKVTTKNQEFIVAVVYLGEVDLRCSVRPFEDKDSYEVLKRDLAKAFHRHSSTELIRLMDRSFPERYFSMKDLFSDQRRRIIGAATKHMYEEQAALFESFYSKNKDLAKLIVNHEVQLPDTFLAAARFVLNRILLRELDKLSRGFFPDELESVMEETKFWKITLDLRSAEKLIRSRILKLVKKLKEKPQDISIAYEIDHFLELGRNLEITLQLGEVQIVFLKIARSLTNSGAIPIPEFFFELADKLAVNLNGASILRD
jgi:alpha-amylase/alpha-mannosidase (GH57 family)